MPEVYDPHRMRIVARIRTDFSEKFGIPRQSGLAEELQGRIVFEPEFRDPNAVRGLTDFDRIWLIWQFSESARSSWSPTVRPPRLGGNRRMGVFATRSPFRPNPLGLSCVRLERIDFDAKDGPVLVVRGADLLDGTPIYDIKPYLPYADAHPEARGGFADEVLSYRLEVVFPEELLCRLPEEKRGALIDVLANDPRPGYQSDPDRIYALAFAGFDIRFRAEDPVLTVTEVLPSKEP